MWKRNCPKCNADISYTNYSNYNRGCKTNTLCYICAAKIRKGQKRTIEQCNRISKATKIAMNNPIIHQKVIDGINTPQVKEKMSINGTQQMRKLLDTDIDKVLWSWKISNGTKQKWLSRPTSEKQQILTQIKNGRKNFQNLMSCPKYKEEHVRKCLCTGKVKNTKPEKELKTILTLNKINYIQQFQLKDKVFDFYIPDFHLLIEVDGIYWHGKNLKNTQMNNMQKKHRKNDKYKNKLAKSLGYNLERVWEDEIDINTINERILNYGK